MPRKLKEISPPIRDTTNTKSGLISDDISSKISQISGENCNGNKPSWGLVFKKREVEVISTVEFPEICKSCKVARLCFTQKIEDLLGYNRDDVIH